MSATTARQAHPSTDELALYVLDAADPAARQRLERHVAGCRDCAAALAAEASAEEDLRALWPHVRRPLAAVVPLAPRLPAVAASMPAVAVPASRPARRPVPGRASFGGFAAAMVAVLLGGFWAERGGSRIAGSELSLSSNATCVASGPVGGDQPPVCSPAPVIALACWGMCANPTSAPSAGLCALPADGICAMP